MDSGEKLRRLGPSIKEPPADFGPGFKEERKMSGLVGILDIGKRALIAYRLAMNVTGHNVANANTPGFSRQRPILTTTLPIDFNPGQLGTGVKVDQIQRMRDQFLDLQVREEMSSVGQWEERQKFLSEIETIFNEPSDNSLNNALAEFWGSWQDLANDPENMAARVNVKEKAKVLCNTFHLLRSKLRRVQEDINQSISGRVEEINSLAQRIAKLNGQIVRIEIRGENANDLRDQRDLLIDKLSKIADISTIELDDGSVSISLAGNSLVERVNTVSLRTSVRSTPYGAVLDVSYGRGGQVLSLTDGELKGLIDLRDEVIPEYIGDLDNLASTLISKVNTLHSAGYGLDGSTTGLNFFSGSNSSDIGVEQTIDEDVSLIAASTDGSPGNGSNALAISDLANQLTMNDNSATFGDFYQSMMGNLGILSQEASQNYTNASLLQNQLENHRQSVAGVSLDEEMANMINYQHSFEAAARIINTVDEMMNTIINQMGV